MRVHGPPNEITEPHFYELLAVPITSSTKLYIQFKILDTPAPINRHVNASQEAGLIATKETAAGSDVRWCRSTPQRDGSYERLLVLRFSKEELGPATKISTYGWL